MTKTRLIPALGIAAGGLVAVFSGLQSLLAHYQVGDLLAQSCSAADAAAWSGSCPSNLLKCLAQMGAGLGVFSPGVSALKAGVFSRPGIGS